MGDRLRDGGRRTLSEPAEAAFVRAQTQRLPVPGLPGIELHQADEATALWHRTEAELGEAGLPPPFWAFAWAGGRGLAGYLLDHPESVAGRRVLDFASGSGLVAIAAAKAGAAHVEAVDIDPFAIAAIGLNGPANGVRIGARRADIIGADVDADLLLAGDIFYDRAFSARVLPWLRRIAGTGIEVLVGDPGRAYRPKEGVRIIDVRTVPAERAIEDADSKQVAILAIQP